MATRRVKITSDGTGPGTRVQDAETGEDVEGCYAFDIHASRMEAVVKVTLYCFAPRMAVEAEVDKIMVAQ